MLLAERGKNEVGVWDGQKVALRLRSLSGAFTPNAAGTDRNQRLTNLVSAALGVIVGIDEACEALFLIRLQQFSAAPGTSHENYTCSDENHRLLEIDAAEEQARNENRHVGQGCAEVWLFQYQQHRNADQGKSLEDFFPCKASTAEIGKVARHNKNEHQLDPFRW